MSRMALYGVAAAATVVLAVALVTRSAPEPGAAPASEPAPACGDPAYHWSDTDPSINLRHVFCGDLRDDGRPVGFHSTQALGQPGVPTLVADTIEPPDRAGIWSATVAFDNGRRKFSTFFPDACTEAQIVASILHAAGNAQPADGTWGLVGPSAPDAGGAGYCLVEGAPFAIRFAYLGHGTDRINTAFPHD